ncbi:MAG: ribose-phosphate diphosphokinase, partial [Chitinivibrionales bacterium]|nr:ribose-phosphate diphosphokinase [Chitinivibrionales bacterium]MBD3357466.1 ribose-phosphate diphosphokinase [Chitinivibrionales bacterium]
MERAPIVREDAPFLVDPSAVMRRGPLTIAGCGSGHEIATRIASRYRERESIAGGSTSVSYQGPIDDRFGDGEIRVRLHESVTGHDVYLVQSLSNPREDATVNENYLAFLIAARALREHGARYITGIVPYLAYARQDKPTLFRREPVTASLMAELTRTAGIDRLITWHPHCRQIQGFYGAAQVNLLEPFTFFSNAFAQLKDRDDVVVVAPDAGASKLVTRVSRRLHIGSALAAKHRPRSEQVSSTRLIGDLRAKRCAIVLDDILAGGGTIRAVVDRIAAQSNIEEIR